MLKSAYGVVLGVSLLALAGCNGGADAPLQGYFAQVVKLKNLDASTFQGQVEFTKSFTVFENQTVCETYQCGVNQVEQCDRQQVCETRQVCGAAETAMTSMTSMAEEAVLSDPAAKPTHEPPPPPPGPAPKPTHLPPPPPPVHCVTQTFCHEINVNCRIVDQPVYCQRNCTTVPKPVTETAPIDSPVVVKISGLVNDSDAAKLDIALGVKANDEFVHAFADPSSVDSDYAFLFGELSASEKSVLVLKSSDYVLSANQNFLVLPANFQRGDQIELNVQVQKSDNSKQFSAIGSTVDLPDLNYFQQ